MVHEYQRRSRIQWNDVTQHRDDVYALPLSAGHQNDQPDILSHLWHSWQQLIDRPLTTVALTTVALTIVALTTVSLTTVALTTVALTTVALTTVALTTVAPDTHLTWHWLDTNTSSFLTAHQHILGYSLSESKSDIRCAGYRNGHCRWTLPVSMTCFLWYFFIVSAGRSLRSLFCTTDTDATPH